MARRERVILGIQALLQPPLREVEHVAGRVVRGGRRKGPRRGPLEPFDLRIIGTQTRERTLDVVDLDTEMVETRRTARLSRIDVEPDVTVTDRHRAARRALG